MSMVGPYACKECTLGRCVKPLTRCDECEARVIQAKASGGTITGRMMGTKASARTIPPGQKFLGPASQKHYDCARLAEEAHQLSIGLGNLCYFRDSPKEALMTELYAYLVEVSHTGVL